MSRWLLYLSGLALAGVLFVLPYEFCMAGTGYGFPFAWLHPGHEMPGEYSLQPELRHGAVFDPLNLTAAVLLWAALQGGLWWLAKRVGRVRKHP